MIVVLTKVFVFFISGEIISNLRDLQSLTIDLKAEKEKQKSEVKHILQQKQRALSDLFKMLAEIGESLKRTVYPKYSQCHCGNTVSQH